MDAVLQASAICFPKVSVDIYTHHLNTVSSKRKLNSVNAASGNPHSSGEVECINMLHY